MSASALPEGRHQLLTLVQQAKKQPVPGKKKKNIQAKKNSKNETEKNPKQQANKNKIKQKTPKRGTGLIVAHRHDPHARKFKG